MIDDNVRERHKTKGECARSKTFGARADEGERTKTFNTELTCDMSLHHRGFE
jgi:hypothetical protein